MLNYDKLISRILKRKGLVDNVLFQGKYGVRCLSPDRKIIKWEDEFDNLVLNGGINYILDAGLSGGAPITSWFLGLLAASPTPLAAWTATEIAANDFVNYDEANLQAWVDGGVSAQSVSNSASVAE